MCQSNVRYLSVLLNSGSLVLPITAVRCCIYCKTNQKLLSSFHNIPDLRTTVPGKFQVRRNRRLTANVGYELDSHIWLNKMAGKQLNVQLKQTNRTTRNLPRTRTSPSPWRVLKMENVCFVSLATSTIDWTVLPSNSAMDAGPIFLDNCLILL